jgi:hypothetical protein
MRTTMIDTLARALRDEGLEVRLDLDDPSSSAPSDQPPSI